MMRSLQVIVKAPNQKIQDQSVLCESDWDVLALKKHLTSVYPNKPRVEDQRLIYSGHLLRNDQKLGDVLKPSEGQEESENKSEKPSVFTVHLVCAQLSDSAKYDTNSTDSNPRSQTTSSSQQSNTNINPPNTRNVNYNANYMQPMYVGYPYGMQGTNIALTPEQMIQQMALMQQAYAQYMGQYAQYFGHNIVPPQVIPNLPISTPVIPPPNAINPQVVVAPQIQLPNQAPVQVLQAVAAQVQQQQVQPQVVQRMNAGPGGGNLPDDEDENNRDWLDWFYYLSRAIVLFSIVYFYSSFSRFVMVIVLAILLYMYQTGWLNRRNPIARRNLVINNNNNNDRDINNRNINNLNVFDNQVNPVPDDVHQEEPINANADTDQPPANRVNNNSEVQTQEERFSGLRMFWVIISSLFTSLIPEQPAPINLN